MHDENTKKQILITQKSLQETVQANLAQYLESCGDYLPKQLYEMVLSQLEKPLFEVVSKQAHGNQSKMTRWLGISRSTLRKQLKIYGMIS